MTRSAVCHLLNLALNNNLSGNKAIQLKKSVFAANSAWQSMLMDLEFNGVAPLVACSLENSDVKECLSANLWGKMQATYRRTRMLNTFLFLTIHQVVKSLEDANLNPVIGTNVFLVDSFYRDPGERKLENIDLLLSFDEILQAKAILKSLGFKLVAHPPRSHQFYLTNSLGISCHLQGVKAKNLRDLTYKIQPERLQLPELMVLEPNAMFAELVAQISDRPLSTVPLYKIADLALFLQKSGHLVEPQRLQMLMPQSDRWQSLWRAIRFLETQLGQQIPTWLSQGASKIDSVADLETLKIQRFLTSNCFQQRKNLVLEIKDLEPLLRVSVMAKYGSERALK